MKMATRHRPVIFISGYGLDETIAREFSDRIDGVVRDVAAFRTVALTDLIKQQFDGHSYVARHRGSGAGRVDRAPQGGGAEGRPLYRRRGDAGRSDQRGWSGAVKASDLSARQSGDRGVRDMRPWRVAVGLPSR